MSESIPHAYLHESLDELISARAHLDFSMHSVADVPADFKACSERQLESIEAFTSRFSRVVDLLTNRVLRALDRYELNEPGTLIDVANRAEKRGLIRSVDWLRELKDVRNRITHDYAGVQLGDIFMFCRSELKELNLVCERVENYIRER